MEIEQEKISQEKYRSGVVKESGDSGLLVEFEDGQVVSILADSSTKLIETNSSLTGAGFVSEEKTFEIEEISPGDRITVTFSEVINLETKEAYATSINRL